MFLDLGFSTALVQKKHINQKLISSVFWINLIISVFVTIIFIISAKFIAQFYENTKLELLCYALSPIFILNIFPQIPRIKLIRNGNFKYLSITTITSTLTAYLVAYVMALNMFEIWSLVALNLIPSFLQSIMLASKVKWIPTFVFYKKEVKKILNFSFYTFSARVSDYLTQNLDGLLIGKKLGAFEMGIYGKSNTITLIPERAISASINGVLYPIYAQLINDKEKQISLYLQNTRYQVFLLLPGIIFLNIYASEIIHLLFGTEWMSMVIIVHIISSIGLLNAIFTSNETLLSSSGHAKKIFKIGLIEKVIFLTGSFIGIQFGLVGIALAKLCANIGVFVPKQIMFYSIFKLSFVKQIMNLKNIIIGSFIMTIALLIFDWLIAAYLIDLARLIWGGILALIIYISYHYISKDSTLLKVLEKVK